MPYQSKTYSLSDEVIAAIEAARAQGLSPNRFLRQLMRLDQPEATRFNSIVTNGKRGSVSRVQREKGDGRR